MKCTLLFGVVLVMFLVLLRQPVESKKVIIHVPYRVKKVEHTHTIYKIVPSYHHKHEDILSKEDLEDDEKYDV
ncbi:uncharacterized protein LOC143357223 [Halictus rubicundus]|uniref:uncharacterized protein LOC143357223 n=1 Tax=Halictus rubicundus TaxID=77578 RepID=UPI004036E459